MPYLKRIKSPDLTYVLLMVIMDWFAAVELAFVGH